MFYIELALQVWDGKCYVRAGQVMASIWKNY